VIRLPQGAVGSQTLAAALPSPTTWSENSAKGASMAPVPTRHRADQCPGVLRPWLADDGALLRIRLVGGRLSATQLAGLATLAATHGDGSLHVTGRANLQVRAVPPDAVPTVAEGVAGLGLLPSPAHERVRNVLLSPLTGRRGGRADLRPVADRLDALLCADEDLAALPARFLFALDDRGDLSRGPGREADLALVALDPTTGRLEAAGAPGQTVPLDRAADELVALARRFLALRGEGPSAAWHVAELPAGPATLGFPPGAAPSADRGAHRPSYGRLAQDDGRSLLHVEIPGGTLTHASTTDLLAAAGHDVVFTPWRSVVLPDLDPEEGR